MIEFWPNELFVISEATKACLLQRKSNCLSRKKSEASFSYFTTLRLFNGDTQASADFQLLFQGIGLTA